MLPVSFARTPAARAAAASAADVSPRLVDASLRSARGLQLFWSCAQFSGGIQRALGERAARLATRIRQLEQRLSQALGEQAGRESRLGQPDDTAQLRQQITQLTEDNQQLQTDLTERDQDLAAARCSRADH